MSSKNKTGIWEEVLSTLLEYAQALYKSHISAMMAEIANNCKERDVLKIKISNTALKIASASIVYWRATSIP